MIKEEEDYDEMGNKGGLFINEKKTRLCLIIKGKAIDKSQSAKSLGITENLLNFYIIK